MRGTDKKMRRETRKLQKRFRDKKYERRTDKIRRQEKPESQTG
jgi:hypothetical protein